jgi:hypothetical protein
VSVLWALGDETERRARRFTVLAQGGGRDVGEGARSAAGDQVAERIGGRLTGEQAHALEVITGSERGAILVGPAGDRQGCRDRRCCAC